MYPVTYTRPESRVLELSASEWGSVFGGTAVAVTVAALTLADFSAWTAAAIALTAVVLCHMCLTVARHVAFPDLIALAGCLQWLIGPLLSDRYPAALPVFKMALPLDSYYAYAVPATLALWVGLQLPVSRRLSRVWALAALPPLSAAARRALDVMIVIGILVETFGYPLVPYQFYFLVYLIGLIRLYGALGWMITQTPGWVLRVAAVGLHFVLQQIASGYFYSIVHWAGYFALIYAFIRGWRWQFAAALLAGLISMGVIQQVKPAFRQSLATRSVADPVGSFVDLLSLVRDQLSGVKVDNESRNLGDVLIRFNQGWITARVMTFVPASQPFAGGQTLIDAAEFSIVPRFLDSSKPVGTSADLFTRYTGVTLAPGTSMGLGLIGEMYANFGQGGIVATFVYGLLVGWLFALFAERALTNPLWWAAAALVLVPSVEPGVNVEDITNHVIKAAILLVIALRTIPAFGTMLGRTPPPELFVAGASAEQAG